MRENKDMRSAGNRLWPPAWPEITLGELRGRAEVRGGQLCHSASPAPSYADRVGGCPEDFPSAAFAVSQL